MIAYDASLLFFQPMKKSKSINDSVSFVEKVAYKVILIVKTCRIYIYTSYIKQFQFFSKETGDKYLQFKKFKVRDEFVLFLE